MPFQLDNLLLIAHRGGVVDEERSENSFKALEEAIRRGYTHVEIDARITADGGVVCFHNDGLMEEAGVEGRISRMPIDDVTQVVLTRSGERIPTFDEYCARCAGRIGVMIDLKGCEDAFVAAYSDEIEACLRRHGLLDDALILINRTPRDNQDVVAARFAGKCRVSWRGSLTEARDLVARDPGFADHRYIFNHGADFTPADIAGFQDLNLPVIVSINRYHYEEGDPIALGRAHVRAMIENGADGLQIDSCYDTEIPGT